MRIQLSNNFNLSEFIRSDTARRLGVKNEPSDVEIVRLGLLCETILQPLRDHFGPVSVLSGYRCPVVNSAVGSSNRSAHPWGFAADVLIPGATSRQVVEWVRDNVDDYDQAIDEFGEWAHLAIAQPVTGEHRRQVLEAYTIEQSTHYRMIRSAS
jgi:hypothetical protein